MNSSCRLARWARRRSPETQPRTPTLLSYTAKIGQVRRVKRRLCPRAPHSVDANHSTISRALPARVYVPPPASSTASSRRPCLRTSALDARRILLSLAAQTASSAHSRTPLRYDEVRPARTPQPRDAHAASAERTEPPRSLESGERAYPCEQ